MNQNYSGAIIKKYRNLLKISQKEASGNRISHSMISLIESGKIQLTTVTAMILADNFNKIAASKGIELNLSLKDLLYNSEPTFEEDIRNELANVDLKCDIEKINNLFEKAKNNNMFNVMADIKNLLAEFYEGINEYEAAIANYNKSFEYYSFLQDKDKTVNTLVSLARCYNNLKQYEDAVKILGDIRKQYDIKKNMDINFLISFEIVKALYNTGENNECLKIIEDSIKNSKNDVEKINKLVFYKAKLYMRNENYPEVCNILLKVIKSAKNVDFEIYHNYAIALLRCNLIEGGIENIKIALELVKNSKDDNCINIILDMAQEMHSYNLEKYCIPYYETVLKICELSSIYDIQLQCYEKIYNIYFSENCISKFSSHSVKIKNLIARNIDDKYKLNCLLILIKYYIATNKLHKIEELISELNQV